MHEQPTSDVLIDYLDLLGQQHGQSPGRNSYIQVSFCYPITNDSLYTTAVEVLIKGLERLTASFPWVAGRIVIDDVSEGNTSVIKVKTLNKIPHFIVKDLRDNESAPTMAALRDDNFPLSMLDEALVAPRRRFPDQADEGFSDLHVFLLQANFIAGGLIVTFNGHHNVMDMAGLAQIISLLSKACSGEPFGAGEIKTGNLSRRNLVPLLDDLWQPGSELSRLLVEANPRPSAPPTLPPKPTPAYFSFPRKSLEDLKSLATSTLPPSLGYISTDDALTAFIWQSITRARLSRIDPHSTVSIGRAVNVRRYLNIPATYPGLMVNMAYHASVVQTLVEAPLGVIASELRATVDPKTSNLGYVARAVATYLHRSPDKSGLSGMASLSLDKDIMVTSWGNASCYDLEFNLGLGKPESVRRPKSHPIEGLFTILPQSPDGEITALLCLRDEEMKNLKTDEEFTQYGRYIG